MVILYLFRVPYDPTIVFFLEADFLFKSILRHCDTTYLFEPKHPSDNYGYKIYLLDVQARNFNRLRWFTDPEYVLKSNILHINLFSALTRPTWKQESSNWSWSTKARATWFLSRQDLRPGPPWFWPLEATQG